MRAHLYRKAYMVQYQPRLRTLRLQFEFRDRIESFRPHGDAPCLDDTLIGQKLNVTPRDDPTEGGKNAPPDFGSISAAAPVNSLNRFASRRRGCRAWTHRRGGGSFAPKGTPRPIVDRLTEALDKALDDPNTRKRLLELGGEVPDKTKRGQRAFAKLVKSEIARWTPIIRAANIKGE